MKLLTETITLKNGVEMPIIGYGTWQIFEGKKAIKTFQNALDIGYRHIDTAQMYENESSVGKAIKASPYHHSDIFVTSKLLPGTNTYQGTINAYEDSLKKLEVDVIDLYLIHAPLPWDDNANIQVWKALENLYLNKRVRAIGVSNFSVQDLKKLIAKTSITPHVNQIRYHVGFDQADTIAFCKEKDIVVEAYSPLGKGSILELPQLVKIAKKYNTTPAQLAIRFCLDMGTIPLPKSQNVHRMKENADLDFKIMKDDLEALSKIRA